MENPEKAVPDFLAQRAVGYACVGYFAAALGWVLFFNIGAGLSVAGLLGKLIIIFAAEVTAGCFAAALCGLFLDFFRVKASSVELFCLLGSSGFIKGLLIAFSLCAAMWPQAHLFLLWPLAALLVLGLQVVYLTRGLMRAYSLSAWKSLVAWLFGLIPFGVAAFLCGIFAVWGMSLLF